MDFHTDTEIYPAGTIIGGYEILSHLASGGMAHVYIALQSKLSRKVAFKVLSGTFATNASVSRRFINEALIVAKLHHPHIVEVYDVGETEDHRPFMAMELLEGQGLGERIKAGPMSPAEAFPIVREVAESLAEAHAKGIIHRDLKPDNIFLTVKSGVKTLDFGIAKVLHGEKDGKEERLTRAGTAPGTPEYMSPEQARGQNLDARSDLYSLGIVLYEMLCGRPPFEEPTFLATILMQVQSPPPPLPDSVPAPLSHYIVHRLLAKDPNCRPKDAEAFIKELDELGQQLKIVSDNDGKSLMNALNEIEQLRLQLAQTKQELQRSRDMACLEEADIEGHQTMPQVSVVSAGRSPLGDGSALVVNPNLGRAVSRSGNPGSGNAGANAGVGSLITPPSSSGQSARPGMMPPNGMPPVGQVPPMMGGASSVVSMSSIHAQASGQPMPSGMMPPNAMSSGSQVPPLMGGASSVVSMSSIHAQASGQPMPSGMIPPMPSAQPSSASTQSMRSGMMPASSGQPMRHGAMSGMPQARPAMAGRPDVSKSVAPQTRRAGTESSDHGRRVGRPASSPSVTPPYRQGNYRPGLSADSGMAGIPEDAVMASQGMEVMRNLNQMDSAARIGTRMSNEVQREVPPSPDRHADTRQTDAQDFYASGVLRDDADWDAGSGSYAQRRPAPERRGRQDGQGYRDGRGYPDVRAYGEEQGRETRQPYDSQLGKRGASSSGSRQPYDAYDEEPICTPKPRFNVQQPSGVAPLPQNRSSDTRRQIVKASIQAVAGDGEREVLEHVNYGSQPKDVMTGKVLRTGASRSAATEPKNVLMTFAQPIGKVFGPDRVAEMLQFAVLIWNACLLGHDAEEELKDKLRDKPNQYKMAQGMIVRKHRYFENEHWFIDDLKVSKDSQGHVKLDFQVTPLV